MSFFFNQRNPKRRRFPIPNDVWKWELKPQGFAILVYLSYLHVHCNKNASPSADEIASQLHMSCFSLTSVTEPSPSTPTCFTAKIAKLISAIPAAVRLPRQYISQRPR